MSRATQVADLGPPRSPTPGGLAIEASGLEKSFGATTALGGVDLSVAAGSIHAILGPNGAGKTTAIRILSTLLAPDGGHASVLGYDVVSQACAVRRRLALTGQFTSLDEDLTATENLVVLGRLLGLSRRASRDRAARLLGVFGLETSASRQVKSYSGGMRRRLDLAASLIVTPELLFLDEPTTGLDPASRAEVWQMIRSLVSGGRTVLLTTQYLEEADQLAGRITVIDQGSVVAEGAPSDLKASVGGGTFEVRLAGSADRATARRILSRLLGVPVHDGEAASTLSARLESAPGANSAGERAAGAIGELGRAGIQVSEFALGQPSLDEVFLTLTGHGTAAASAIEDDKERVS